MRNLLLFVLLCAASALSAQAYKSRIHYKVVLGDTSQLHQIILLDYTKLLGTAMRVEDENIYFLVRSAAEESTIPLRELRYVGVFVDAEDNVRKGRGQVLGFYDTPGFTDLTYERTALPLHGRGQVRIINLLYAVTEFNLNENVQVGAGLAGPLGVLLTQKVRFSVTPEVHVGVIGQQLWTPLVFSFDGTPFLGDIAGIVTLGNDRRFANFGTGILFNTDDRNSPVWAHRFGIGGRVSERWHIYGEFLMSRGNPERTFSNLLLFPSLNASLGIRRHRWQFGIFSFFSDEDSFVPPPLPYVGYSYYW